MKEVWRFIEEYEGYYEISDQGRVRSVDRNVLSGEVTIFIKGKIRSPGKNNKGYLYIALSKEGKLKTKYVHRLVAAAFLDGRTVERDQVNHKNFITTDNRASNLEWCSAKENVSHAVLGGRRSSYLTQTDVDRIIMSIEAGESRKKIATRHNICTTTLQKILLGEIYFDSSRKYPIGEIKRKLSVGEVKDILTDRVEGLSLGQIASKYRIDQSTVSRIASGDSWKSLQSLENS